MRYVNPFRLIRLAVLSLLLGLIGAVMPASACGCGVYIPQEGESNVTEERTLLRWDGQTEDIVMSLDVNGKSAEAAWILPVPAPAEVRLADPGLFELLQELTKPREEEELVIRLPLDGLGGAGAAPGAAPVTLLKRQSLGPFDVSSLAAQDAAALSDWLATNGYTFPEDLAGALQPYVEQEWYYVAVRLTPGAGSKVLTGTLDPLWVTFPSQEMVYPMRLSALASAGMPVYLYVLAEHRVDKSESFGTSQVTFADWLEPASLEPHSPLAPFITRKLFLTKFQDYIYPTEIDGDFYFTFAAEDTLYHEVKIKPVDEIAGVSTFVLVQCLAPLLLLLLGTAGVIFFRWRRRAVIPA